MALPDTIRAQIDERLAELEPYVAEYRELQAMRGLAEAEGQPKRRFSTEERQQQVVSLVREHPGIRVKDLAERLGVSVPRVVQIVNTLEAGSTISRSSGGLRLP